MPTVRIKAPADWTREQIDQYVEENMESIRAQVQEQSQSDLPLTTSPAIEQGPEDPGPEVQEATEFGLPDYVSAFTTGATFGLAPRFDAFMQSLTSDDSYSSIRDSLLERQRQFREEEPLKALLTEGGGAVASPVPFTKIPSFLNKVPSFLTAAKTPIGNIAQGAGLGALYSESVTPGDFNPLSRESAYGAAAGAAGGALGNVLSKAFPRRGAGFDEAKDGTIGNIVLETAVKEGVDLTPGMRTQGKGLLGYLEGREVARARGETDKFLDELYDSADKLAKTHPEYDPATPPIGVNREVLQDNPVPDAFTAARRRAADQIDDMFHRGVITVAHRSRAPGSVFHRKGTRREEFGTPNDTIPREGTLGDEMAHNLVTGTLNNVPEATTIAQAPSLAADIAFHAIPGAAGFAAAGPLGLSATLAPQAGRLALQQAYKNPRLLRALGGTSNPGVQDTLARLYRTRYPITTGGAE